jgi:PKD repeat protein
MVCACGDGAGGHTEPECEDAACAEAGPAADAGGGDADSQHTQEAGAVDARSDEPDADSMASDDAGDPDAGGTDAGDTDAGGEDADAAPGGEDATVADAGGEGLDGAPQDAAAIDDAAATADAEAAVAVGPTAGFSLSPNAGVIPLVVQASSTAIAGDTPIVSVRYDFTGAGFAASTSHRYADPGQVTIRQEVRDQNGLTAVASVALTIADFQPVRWSATDHDPLVFLSPDRLMVENRGEDRGGARSDRAVQPGAGVFYFEAERLIPFPGEWGVGVGTASAAMDQQVGTSAQSLGINTYGRVNNAGATCNGGDNFDPAQRHYGFVIDYRGATANVHVLLEGAAARSPVVQRSCATTLNAPLYILYAGVRYAVGYQLKLNAGSDLTNFPFYFSPDGVRAALGAAGLADAAAALVPGFGQSRTPPPDTAPLLNVPADRTVAVGTLVALSATASDTEDGDLSASIVWRVLSSQHDAPVTGTGSSFNFTPGVIGTHPISVSVTDRDGVITERVVKVVASGPLPQFDPVRLAPDALSGPGIVLSGDGLSARFESFGKYGIRANQPIFGHYWYFEAHRNGPPGNMGVGLIIGDGALNPYDFVNVPWSCSINFTGNSWRNLISQLDWNNSIAHYGFAVDYRDVHPKVHIIIGGALHTTMHLDDVWVPLHPMAYGNPQGSAAPAMDVTLNFGASPFQFDPRAILNGAGVDTTGLELGWGDANTP